MLTQESRSTDFPGLRARSYLNTAAEGIPPQSESEALQTYHEHKLLGMDGREFLFREMAATRKSAATLLGLSSPEEVAFCSSTSEAFNLLATSINFGNTGEAIITDLDFPAGATPWLLHRDRPTVKLWNNRDGSLELDDLAQLLTPATRLVQVSLVSFLTGYRIPWKEVHDLVRSKAPEAILSVDVTQAAGRVLLPCGDADCIIASGYKWLLGSHGSAVVAVPEPSRDRVRVQAGGWHHLVNAFDADRFERAVPESGAPGFSVGMPSFPAIYSLRAGIDYLLGIGVDEVERVSNPLVARLHEGLSELGIRTMSSAQPDSPSGILAFQSSHDDALHAHLNERSVEVMHQAGRIRISVHGYNTEEDVEQCLEAIRTFPA